MGKLICEMCEGNDFAKQDGFFVCQNCGTKYTLEEAKKLMSDEAASAVTDIVQKKGNAQIDNLLNLAQSSFNSRNYAQAEEFCNQVLALDANSYPAWKLKGEAINYQINAQNPRILEVYNCLMTAYDVLDDEGKEENKSDIMDSVKNCYVSEMDFWLNQIEVQRPTESAINKAIATFNDALDKIAEAAEKMGLDAEDDYDQSYLSNYFIGEVNQKCVSTWKSTVGYNYYRESFDENNYLLTHNSVQWKFDSYRPDTDIFRTFVAECDNLIRLLSFATTLFDDNTENEDIINTYENMIFMNSHALHARSYKRMVSTTTNGYGAVTDRKEYWEIDRTLTDEAKQIRTTNNQTYKERIGALIPAYKKADGLKEQVASLNKEINGLVTERKLHSVGCAVFAVIVGVFIHLMGVWNLHPSDRTAPTTIGIIIGLLGLIYGLRKTPSQRVVEQNIVKKEQLLKEREELQKALNEIDL